jgi:hypothetical protein
MLALIEILQSPFLKALYFRAGDIWLSGDARSLHPDGPDMPAGHSEAGGTGRAAAACLAAMRTPSAQTRASAERFGL